jgi:hypothetical protein
MQPRPRAADPQQLLDHEQGEHDVKMSGRVLKFSRRHLVAVFVGPIAVALSVASPVAFITQASAATTASVSITLDEPKVADFVRGCAVFLAGQGLCGTGVAVPYGHATETILFGRCAPSGSVRCDLRTVTVASGSIFLDEFAGNFTCNNANAGACEAPLTDVVAGGTGAFAGATGSLTGTVTGTGPQSQIKLQGTITTA